MVATKYTNTLKKDKRKKNRERKRSARWITFSYFLFMLNTWTLQAEHKNPSWLKYEPPFVIISAVCHHYHSHISKGRLALPRSMTVFYKNSKWKDCRDQRFETITEKDGRNVGLSIPKTGLYFFMPMMKAWYVNEKGGFNKSYPDKPVLSIISCKLYKKNN